MNTSSQNLEFDSSAEAELSWKQEVNERLAAHRTRRTRRPENHPRLPLGAEEPESSFRETGASVAARVAARYAKAPSYSEMIAAEALAAAEAAKAAVEAAQQAQAATQAILEGLERAEEVRAAEQRRSDKTGAEETGSEKAGPEKTGPGSERWSAQPGINGSTVAAGRSSTKPEPAAPRPVTPHPFVDPFEEALVLPPQPLPANLIEFPRELIAARRARPRLAEGPLRDEASADPEKSQLRIFEVETETISSIPDVEPGSTEWSSIRLDAHPRPTTDGEDTRHDHARSSSGPLYTAPTGDRVMAAVIDLTLILTGFLVFIAVFVACTTHPPTGKAAAAGASLVLVAFALVYQLLFFTYAEGTPGMRYARIALCTFDDDNPTRKAMRVRIAALVLSLCPLGLGLAWAFFDEDRLSWHDRLTRMYQRSYR